MVCVQGHGPTSAPSGEFERTLGMDRLPVPELERVRRANKKL